MNVTSATEAAIGSLGMHNGAQYLQHLAEEGFNTAANAVAAALSAVEQRVPVTFLCCALVLAPFLAGATRALWPFLRSWLVSKTVIGGTAGGLPFIHRNIEVRLPPFNYVIVPNHNIFLQNAVLVYLCDHVWKAHPIKSSALRTCELSVELIDPYRSWRAYVQNFSPFQAGRAVNRSPDAAHPDTLEELNRLRIVKMPADTWVPAVEDGIELFLHEELYTLADYSRPWTRRTLTLRCPAVPGAAAKLDGFVKRALELFAEQAPAKEASDARWFFTYGGESGEQVFFQQYVLRSNKGFDTLFFPQRAATLTLVDQFVQRRGRFAVEGFPQKLGFLLYGPSGTGRHTFVKALAAYTGRHIVSVPLSKLRTNQQLYDIFFVREFKSEENGSAQRLRMEDVIFLFDDVDASEPVVCARAARRVVQRRAAARLTAREGGGGGALTNCVIEMDTSSSRPVVKAAESALPLAMLMELVMGGGGAAGGASAEGSVKGDGAGGGGGDAAGEAGGSHGRRKKARKGGAGGGGEGGAKGGDGALDALGGHLFGMNDMLSGENKDRLDLAGVLNVLDGVVDAPGRMVVMITEHPEWLDPALIRPGRFSARLRFDYIEMEALVSMLGLYYGDVEHPRDADDAGGAGAGAGAVSDEARARGARAVHRELSGAQAAVVRGAVAALEAEAAARGEGCGYRFHVTPCEVEMLCMEQDTLAGFVERLEELVRGALVL